jgi:alpha-beta hydrolase superfamily lysophospholipase
VYQELDHSPLIRYLFYPRKTFSRPPAGARDLLVPVEQEVFVACRLFGGSPGGPWLLYFHGNGEVASDYDELAPLYRDIRVNLAVAEYRGYGKSSGGSPSFTAMMADAHLLLQEVSAEIHREEKARELWIMGRSLGSMAALELAAEFQAEALPLDVKGVIFESGFLSVTGLIQHLGLPRGKVDLEALEREGRQKAARVALPSLVLHGEADSLVPFRQGEELYRSLGSEDKRLVAIPGGEHNNIMMVDVPRYFGALQDFLHPS